MSVKQIFNTSAQLDYPTVLPTLDLDFANSKTLDPRITFTRASGGSYYGADGLIKLAGVNEPRFDHDPYTGESLGFLVEEARTNMQTYSQEFSNAGWVKVGSTITPSATTAPNGTITAFKLSEDTSSGVHKIAWDYGGGTGASTATIFLKAAERTTVYFYRYDGDPYYATVDLQAGTINGNSWYTATLTPLNNGWYRASIYTAAGWGNFVVALTNGTTNSYTGTPGSGVFIWGAQNEAGAFPTSYIPTEASTRTRAADNASITGKNFSSWYNTNQGTVLCDYRTLQPSGWAVVWQLLVGSNQGFLGLQYGTSFASFSRQAGGLLGSSAGVSFTNNLNKTIVSYSAVSSTASVTTNGAAPSSGSQTVLNTINTLQFYGPPDPQLTKTITRFTYYPKRLTNQQLQTLTT